VTIISWLLIVLGGVFLIDNWDVLKMKDTLLQSMWTFFRMLFPLISGIGMLKRQNWDRFLLLNLLDISFRDLHFKKSDDNWINRRDGSLFDYYFFPVPSRSQ